MLIDNVGIKDVLDWTMPLILGWAGSGVRKYLKAIRSEMAQAKDSVLQLNIQIAKILERTEAHQRELESHEKRISNVEHRSPRREK